MKKSDMVSEINTIVANMMPGIKEAKISDKHFFIHEDIILLTAKQLKEGYDWLMAIYQNEYKQYQTIKNLCPKHVWEAYQQLDMGGAREMKLLKQAIKELRKKFISAHKPMCFKKGLASVTIQKRQKSKTSNKKSE